MSANVHFSARKKVKTKTKMKVITSAHVYFSAPKQVKTEKKIITSQAVVCTETFQNFSWKNDFTCFHCS